MTTLVAGLQTPSPPKHVQLDQPELAGDDRDNLSVFSLIADLMQVLPAGGAYPFGQIMKHCLFEEMIETMTENIVVFHVFHLFPMSFWPNLSPSRSTC